ncbi:MAG: DUF5319 family protein [Actinomycetota bacterium]|nr:DUF5319 family protein [Actinomycetota bacterium]
MRDDFDDADDDDDHEPVPLDRHERARVRRDLDDLAKFRATFEPEGFRGVSMFCADCAEEHFYDWAILAQNLEALLASGEVPVHEPAYDPRPDQYVDWEYAGGYLDGLADAGAPVLPVPAAESDDCPFCARPLPEDGQTPFCPRCGTHLAPARIARALLERGWTAAAVSELLRGARVPRMRSLPPA